MDLDSKTNAHRHGLHERTRVCTLFCAAKEGPVAINGAKRANQGAGKKITKQVQAYTLRGDWATLQRMRCWVCCRIVGVWTSFPNAVAPRSLRCSTSHMAKAVDTSLETVRMIRAALPICEFNHTQLLTCHYQQQQLQHGAFQRGVPQLWGSPKRSIGTRRDGFVLTPSCRLDLTERVQELRLFVQEQRYNCRKKLPKQTAEIPRTHGQQRSLQMQRFLSSRRVLYSWRCGWIDGGSIKGTSNNGTRQNPFYLFLLFIWHPTTVLVATRQKRSHVGGYLERHRAPNFHHGFAIHR